MTNVTENTPARELTTHDDPCAPSVGLADLSDLAKVRTVDRDGVRVRRRAHGWTVDVGPALTPKQARAAVLRILRADLEEARKAPDCAELYDLGVASGRAWRAHHAAAGMAHNMRHTLGPAICCSPAWKTMTRGQKVAVELGVLEGLYGRALGPYAWAWPHLGGVTLDDLSPRAGAMARLYSIAKVTVIPDSAEVRPGICDGRTWTCAVGDGAPVEEINDHANAFALGEIGGVLGRVRDLPDPREIYASGEAFGRQFVRHMVEHLGHVGFELWWSWAEGVAMCRAERDGIPKGGEGVYALGFLHGCSGAPLGPLAWVAKLDGFEPDGVIFH